MYHPYKMVWFEYVESKFPRTKCSNQYFVYRISRFCTFGCNAWVITNGMHKRTSSKNILSKKLFDNLIFTLIWYVLCHNVWNVYMWYICVIYVCYMNMKICIWIRKYLPQSVITNRVLDKSYLKYIYIYTHRYVYVYIYNYNRIRNIFIQRSNFKSWIHRFILTVVISTKRLSILHSYGRSTFWSLMGLVMSIISQCSVWYR